MVLRPPHGQPQCLLLANGPLSCLLFSLSPSNPCAQLPQGSLGNVPHRSASSTVCSHGMACLLFTVLISVWNHIHSGGYLLNVCLLTPDSWPLESRNHIWCSLSCTLPLTSRRFLKYIFLGGREGYLKPWDLIRNGY